jgi:hypothetical protein
MIVRAFALAAAVVIGAGSAAFALDHSTRATNPRGPAESCCGQTALLPPLETSAVSESQAVADLIQIAPVAEVKPGLDGANWSCRRPDGSRRCFSALHDQ